MKHLFDFMVDVTRKHAESLECDSCGKYGETQNYYGPHLCRDCFQEAHEFLKYAKESEENMIPLTDLPEHIINRILK